MPHVLVVDYDDENRGAMVDAAERRGCSAASVASVDEALAAHRRQPADFILTAPSLPDGGALDLLLRLSPRHSPHVLIATKDRRSAALFASSRSGYVSCASREDCPAELDRLLRAGPTLKSVMDPAADPEDRAGETSWRLGSLLGACATMREVYRMIRRVAPTKAPVLLVGASGTGKELAAEAIHQHSTRAGMPFTDLNCGAIPPNLIESELFGHERGAFTGADRMRRGVFERASGGTLFLDEITEMPVDLQVRLLRVLESGVLRRVGGEEDFEADVRLITASNRDPRDAVRDGALREDLLYRLSVFPIYLPPLRQRGEDVVLLARTFLSEFNQENGENKELTRVGIQRLRAYHWPGNVRQLRNMVQRAFILEGSGIKMACLDGLLSGGAGAGESFLTDEAKVGPPDSDVELPLGTSIADAEERLIRRTLGTYEGDKKKAARVLGISLKTLYNRLKQYEQRDGEDPNHRTA